MHIPGYRRDIDGLRALAVIPVVLFHFGVNGFTGGFVGVDIFFVISGFLITSIIWRERLTGQFSFVNFWVRRARRILPALFVMMIAAVVVGWFLMAPKDYEELGRSMRYQVMFASNILFMRQTGYFDVASDLKPLLHTWSLAVEEQFYIVFPLFLILLSNHLKHWRVALFAVLLVSFGLSVWAVALQPQKAFFLLPMRAWELLIGAMLAVMPMTRRPVAPVLAQLVSVAGLGLILTAVLCYEKNTPFPGAAALLPTLGAAALIWANGQRPTLVGRLLASRPMVGIGLISYSWYLWHWPIFVFGNYASVDGLTLVDIIALILLSLLLGYLSWRFVETPFREKRLLVGRKQTLIATGTAILVLGLVGQTLRWTEGFPWRLSEPARQYAQGKDWTLGQRACMAKSDTANDRLFCRFGTPGQSLPVLVWGDSHAAALGPSLKSAAGKYGVNVMLTSYPGCLPVAGLENSRPCSRFNARVEQAMQDNSFGDVVIIAHWSLYLYGESGDRQQALKDPATGRYDRRAAEHLLAKGIRASVEQLRAAGHRVWLVKDVPLQAFRVPYRLSRLAMLHQPTVGLGLPLAKHLEQEAFISQLFAEITADDPGVMVLDPTPVLCDAAVCHTELNGNSLYMDDNHLSDIGARVAEPLFDPLFLDLQARMRLRSGTSNAAN